MVLCGVHVDGLERDRISCYVDKNQDSCFARDCPLCFEHSSGEQWQVAESLFKSLPATGSACRSCGAPSIYWGFDAAR